MKTKDMNELRQTKEYQGIANIHTNDEPNKPARRGYSEIDIETTKDLIFNSLKNKFYDMIFQAVCDEMSKHEVFQMETYFTPQGEEWFEDAWFEFYHEHHGDILGSIMKDFTN
tara:strand:- start:6064 stop:6402 length:339 start_codon:yes stop_codon:yes gene_type:complete